MHYIRHLALVLKKLGPGPSISARSMERMIGLISRRIKSRSKPEANASNIMYKVAQRRYFKNIIIDVENSENIKKKVISRYIIIWYQE